MLQHIAYFDEHVLKTALERHIDNGWFVDAVVWCGDKCLFMVVWHEQI